MIEEDHPETWARCRKRYPPTPDTTRPRRWRNSTPWEWTPFVAPEKNPPRLGAATGAPRPHTQGAVSQGPDAPQAADETGQGTLRASDGDGGTGIRARSSRGVVSGSSCCGVLAKVNREWLLICAGHNLLKLFRFGAGDVRQGAGAKALLGNNRATCRAIGRGIFKRQSACA